MPTLATLLSLLYMALPVIGGAIGVYIARRRRDIKPIVSFALTVLSSLLISTTLCLVLAWMMGVRATIGQILLTAYLLVGVMTVLKGFSWLLKEGAERLFRVHISQPSARPRGAGWAARLAGATLVRVLLLFAIGLPYIMSLGMVYRPKFVGGENPREQLGTPFEDVEFRSTDGVKLAGWWIPARPATPITFGPTTQAASRPAAHRKLARADDWGQKTVIVCHGLGANKSNQLLVARDLVVNGYNVLIFDFRAHGSSGGQLSSFGDRERYDVLGAVRWLREQRPGQSRKIVGLGISMGGAALLAAAAEDTEDARALDAVAVFSTYDNLGSLADDLADGFLIAPVGWLARNVGVPLAGAMTGSNLAAFSPVQSADKIAPRPIMVVHGRGDFLIPFETGVRLFEQAQMPKVRLWVGELDASTPPHYVIRTNAKYITDENGVQRLQTPAGPPADHNNLIYYDEGLKAVRLFFEEAKAMS